MMVTRNLTYGVHVAVLGILVAGCDHVTGVRVTIQAQRPIDPACIPRSTEYLSPDTQLSRLAAQPGIPGEQYVVIRERAHINLGRYEDQQRAIWLEFGWVGPPTKEEQKANVRLLEDMERAVLKACELSGENARITRTCNGNVCREAGIRQ